MPDAAQVTVGVAQTNSRLGDVDANIENHRQWIVAARREGLDLLVFPELSLTGYRLRRSVANVAMAKDDARLTALAGSVGEMHVVVGFVESASPGEYYNALAVLHNNRVIATYRKINLPNYGALEEGKLYGHGRRLVDTDIAPGWPATFLICADAWNPGLVHAAMLGRPSLLIAPANSATGVVSDAFSNERNWVTNITFYAMTYGTLVVLANRYGPEEDAFFWGGSRIVGPRGETLAVADDAETLIQATVTHSAIAQARFDLPTHRDANTPLVRNLLRERDP